MSDFQIQVTLGKRAAPWKICLYGTPGIGKSTLASYAPEPLFLNLEEGLDRVDAAKTQKLKSLQEFAAGISFALESNYKTIVIDTITALEELLSPLAVDAYNHTLTDKSKYVQDVSQIGWNKGGQFLAAQWWKLMRGGIQRLQEAGKNVILIGHERVELVKDPMVENYNRYSMRVEKLSAEVISSECDAVLFAHSPRYVQAKDDGKGKLATGSGERLLLCQEEPFALAKNRFGLPSKIPMDRTLFERLV